MPLALTDDELAAVMSAAKPIPPDRRDAFLHAVADALAASLAPAHCIASWPGCSARSSTRQISTEWRKSRARRDGLAAASIVETDDATTSAPR
jgi:hypothetical protein